MIFVNTQTSDVGRTGMETDESRELLLVGRMRTLMTVYGVGPRHIGFHVLHQTGYGPTNVVRLFEVTCFKLSER